VHKHSSSRAAQQQQQAIDVVWLDKEGQMVVQEAVDFR
jgi:hypothetical protein